MRLFVAIQIPEAIRSDMARWTRTLTHEIPDPKNRLHWVKKDQFHLTLKFLGETRDDRLPALSQALRSASNDNDSFSLSLSKVGHFGGRVVWLGLKTGMDEASQLANSIDAACAALSFDRENRPFQPHITLARSKINPGTILLKSLSPSVAEQTFGPFAATEVSLVQSTLTPNGAIYKTLAQFPLSGDKRVGGAMLP